MCIPSYSSHALARAQERAGVNLGPDVVRDLLFLAEANARSCAVDTAILVKKHKFIGRAWSNTSNGDTLVAIVRNQAVVTYMFRRSSQPFTPESLRVQKVSVLTSL